jgi:tRNA threonylcarbamoyladenosine biosynthesis protein TsaB
MIDTSTDDSIVAVCAGETCFQKYSHSRASHSCVIFSHIDECLSSAEISIRDIDIVGVGIGPGSFTGLRIAVSTSRMIAQLIKKPLVGIHSQYLYASALQADPAAEVKDGDILLPAFDAKKSRVFAGVYRASGNSTQTVLAAGDYYPSEIAAAVPDGSRVIACGNGAPLCSGSFAGTDTLCSTIEGFLPGGKGMAKAFLGAFGMNPSAYSDYSAVLPFYARKSDAEILHLQKISG